MLAQGDQIRYDGVISKLADVQVGHLHEPAQCRMCLPPCNQYRLHYGKQYMVRQCCIHSDEARSIKVCYDASADWHGTGSGIHISIRGAAYLYYILHGSLEG